MIMDAAELLKTWPSWEHASLETVLASPAWRMGARYGATAATLVRAAALPDDPIALAVTFDGAPAVLALADSALYPDLHLLWSRRAALPPALVLALVEKECGDLFALLEACTRRLFGVTGFAEAPPAHPVAFAVEGLAAPLAFALDLPAELLPVFGSLACLDPAHPAIRGATREIWADYGALAATDEELAALAPGDYLLRGEAAAARWLTAPPADVAAHVVGRRPQTATFAAFADDALPPVPAPSDLVVVKGGRACARVTPASVGEAAAFRVEERI